MANERPDYEESLVQKVEKKWLLPLAVAGLIFFVLILIAGLATWITSNALVNADNQASNANAKAVLRTAVTDANQYAVDNSNIFTDMDAATLSKIDSSIQWIDGQPASGQVGITDTGESTFILVYVDAGGNIYQATRNDQGVVKYTGPNGKPL
jgi:hypothetical protein